MEPRAGFSFSAPASVQQTPSFAVAVPPSSMQAGRNAGDDEMEEVSQPVSSNSLAHLSTRTSLGPDSVALQHLSYDVPLQGSQLAKRKRRAAFLLKVGHMRIAFEEGMKQVGIFARFYPKKLERGENAEF